MKRTDFDDVMIELADCFNYRVNEKQANAWYKHLSNRSIPYPVFAKIAERLQISEQRFPSLSLIVKNCGALIAEQYDEEKQREQEAAERGWGGDKAKCSTQWQERGRKLAMQMTRKEISLDEFWAKCDEWSAEKGLAPARRS